MKKIGILSDTHGYVPESLFDFFKDCDELWHAGDWGDLKTYELLKNFKPLKSVYGNIDGQELRIQMPEILDFQCEDLQICMLHIGGYPSHYSPIFKKQMNLKSYDLMICGHSHILKAMKDPLTGMMHLNPGAAGKHGFHKVSTAMRLKFDKKRMYELEVWEQKK